MASPAEATDQAGPSAAHDPIDEFINTRVHILWTPAADTPADASSTPSTLPLFLQIQYHAAHSLTYVQLQLRNVAFNKGVRKSFYLLIPPERIDTLSLCNTEFSTLIDDDVYRLDMVLAEPLDLVGPRCYGHEAGWPGGKGDMKQLRSLAQALRFTLLVPTAGLTKSQLLDFCAAVTRGLRSLPRRYNYQRLYGGAGGYVYPVQRQSTPAPSPASDIPTVPADTPPEYRVHAPSPGQENDGTVPAQASTLGKRHSSRDPDPCPPPKRRDGDLPAFTVDPAPSATTQPIRDWHQETDLLHRTQPDLGDVVRILLGQREAIEQLRGEVVGLRQSHADLAKRYADLGMSHANLAKTNAELERQMDGQVRALGKDLQKVERVVEDWVPNMRNTCDKVAIELRPLVSDIVDDIFEEDIPEGIDKAIRSRVHNVVESRFSALQSKIREAFEVDEEA